MNQKCAWKLHESEVREDSTIFTYSASCGFWQDLDGETPSEAGFNFCPKCGGSVLVGPLWAPVPEDGETFDEFVQRDLEMEEAKCS